MAGHSQKWHDGSTSRKVSNGSSDGIAAIANILDSLERDMKKLKENVHVIQVGCETCGGAHLDKEYLSTTLLVAHCEPTPREVTSGELPIVSYYVAPYEPEILFPRRLKQHAEEALVHKTMKILKSIKASCDPYYDQCDGGYLPNNTEKKCYWGCLNDDKRLDVAWEGMSPKDWVRVSHGKVCAMTKERILKDYGRREPDQEEKIDLNPNFDPTQEENSNTEEDCEDLKNLGRKN
ncbi:hypothetical protein Tco_1015117 [Tanacetum coccineum]|uniref:Uncharacterized protein n=1 Tax=Tanacetum coccineum TaxID=301880 RepID=A0ABQ5FMB5_9ASTR